MIPLFKSHYSLGRSILTLEDKDQEDNYPDSIIQICKANKMNALCLVEDNMSSFLEAYTNTTKNNINLSYGLRISVTESMEEKTEDSIAKTSKIIIFIKNKKGYQTLTKLYSIGAKTGFYYEPRIDYELLKKHWNDHLILCIPFYDSFIFNNALRNNICVPNFSFTKPILFVESNNLPFEDIVNEKLLKFSEENNLQMLKTKSIFYNKKIDFKSYLTFRCINNRSTLNKPELEHMTSNDFCFESWKQENK